MCYLNRILVSAAVALALTQLPVSHGDGQSAKGPTHRAVLVGVNVYQPQKTAALPREKAGITNEAPKKQPARAQRTGGRAAFSNLYGPVADVVAMRTLLQRKYDFTVIKTLEDQKATRAGILDAIRNDLIDDAAPGDVCLFYYAGHGSRVRNSKGGEPDGYDESLVPADSNQGALDIRDKELARLFLEALKKGVTLTAIFDSCHSGSIGRGYPSEERTRMLPYIETDVAEEPGFKDPPGRLGALILSACQDNESANEKRYNNENHGNFTWALVNVLSQPSVSVNESAERLFQRVTSYMKGEGVSHQPVLEGDQARRGGPLFGGPSNAAADGPTASLVKMHDRVIADLQGGIAMGLTKNSELRKLKGGANEKAVRLRVTEVKSLDSSEAIVIEGNAATLKPGDLFVIDLWAAPERADLKVWIPPADTREDLARAGQEVTALGKSDRVELVNDPTEHTPAYVVQYDQSGWRALMPDGASQVIGPAQALSKFASAIATHSPMFVNLPPSSEFRQALKLGAGTRRPAIEVTKSPAEANYILAGRLNGNTIEYAWLRPGVTAADKEKRNDALPIRTDWTPADADPSAAAEKLEAQAVTLSRIRGWLEIQPTSSQAFPYRLALRNTDTGQIIQEGEVQGGLSYDLVLVANDASLQLLQDQKRYVKQQRIYVFSIDNHGDSSLLFPPSGDVENVYPIDPDKPPLQQPTLIVLGKPGLIDIGPPFGLDTYIMLSSDERIPDPNVLGFTGVISKSRGNDTPLARLLEGIGSATRAPQANVPQNWSLDRMYLRSVGKPQ
jgi:uncharacterized caspase-like protein